jgi:hypothetical protein
MKNIVLAAFLVIQYELDGDVRVARPFRIWRIGTVAACLERNA